MTSHCKESLFQIWEDSLWTYNLMDYSDELAVGSAVLALALCKQLKKLNVTREEILQRFEQSPHRNKPSAWCYYAFLAGNLITTDGYSGLELDVVPDGELAELDTIDREQRWVRNVLIERGATGDAATKTPHPGTWPK